MISCSPRLTPGRVLPEYYNAGEKGKIAEGKFDLKKLKEEQKRNTLLPAQKVNQESFKKVGFCMTGSTITFFGC